jgi:hypothetical protein
LWRFHAANLQVQRSWEKEGGFVVVDIFAPLTNNVPHGLAEGVRPSLWLGILNQTMGSQALQMP